MASSASASSLANAQDNVKVYLQVAYRGQSHEIVSESTSTFAKLQEQIANLTQVDATNQKLLGSGPLRSILGKAKENEAKTLVELGITTTRTRPIKVMLVGPTNDELDQIHKGDIEAEKRNRPRQYHPSMLRGGKVSVMDLISKSPQMLRKDFLFGSLAIPTLQPSAVPFTLSKSTPCLHPLHPSMIKSCPDYINSVPIQLFFISVNYTAFK